MPEPAPFQRLTFRIALVQVAPPLAPNCIHAFVEIDDVEPVEQHQRLDGVLPN
jgi:hypothetical protein